MAQNTLDLIIRSKKTGDAVGQTKSELSGLKSGIEDMTGINLGAAAAFSALAAGISFSIEAAGEAQVVDAQLAAVIESTGGAAGLTAEQLDRMAVKLSDLTGVEDETIKKAEAVLLTFTKIGGDIFPQATTAALNMSAAMGQDLQSSIVMIGKALNDPIAGITSLTRVGVSFTEEQKNMIAAMVESGDVMGAQTLIIQELNTEFGGAAEAMGNTYPGQVEKLKNAFGDLGEEVGGNLIPHLTTAATLLTTLLTSNRKIKDAIAEHSEEVVGTAANYEEYRAEMERALNAAGLFITEQDGQEQVMKVVGNSLVDVTGEYDLLTEAEFEAQKATEELSAEYVALDDNYNVTIETADALTTSTGELTEATDDSAEATVAAAGKAAEYAAAIDGLIGSADEAEATILRLNQAIADLPDSKVITITVAYVTTGTPPTGVQTILPKGPNQAVGGEYTVTAPTVFLAGEAGPERVSFSPVNSGGGGGGGGGVYIGELNVFAAPGMNEGALSQQVIADLAEAERSAAMSGAGFAG